MPSSSQQSPIDAATQEVAARIARAKPFLAQFLDTTAHNPAPTSGPNVRASGIDIALVLDTSLTMALNVTLARNLAPFQGGQLAAMNGSIALVGYTDAATSSATALSDFSTTIADVQAKLDAIIPSGTDTAPQGVVGDLATPLSGLTWRPDATKAVIVLTDAQLSPAVLPSLPALLAKVNALGALGDYAKVSFYPVVPSAVAPVVPVAPVAILAHPSYSPPGGRSHHLQSLAVLLTQQHPCKFCLELQRRRHH
ncbi:VWA domain-containing protein [Arthrobacter alpinus]|uniref:VWA domain-containing protein n=1 Tax=Arthrobacter alpinus TaxID=656366 RepID=UPI00164445E4|nr:VWA domain-containing protein [Arthrobacter alpinus]